MSKLLSPEATERVREIVRRRIREDDRAILVARANSQDRFVEVYGFTAHAAIIDALTEIHGEEWPKTATNWFNSLSAQCATIRGSHYSPHNCLFISGLCRQVYESLQPQITHEV